MVQQQAYLLDGHIRLRVLSDSLHPAVYYHWSQATGRGTGRVGNEREPDQVSADSQRYHRDSRGHDQHDAVFREAHRDRKNAR